MQRNNECPPSKHGGHSHSQVGQILELTNEARRTISKRVVVLGRREITPRVLLAQTRQLEQDYTDDLFSWLPELRFR
jgi:hypothetical protein